MRAVGRVALEVTSSGCQTETCGATAVTTASCSARITGRTVVPSPVETILALLTHAVRALDRRQGVVLHGLELGEL
jgi:hypothetical protein